MIKLVITDLDGTLLNSAGVFDHAYYARVKKLMDERGVIFAACTGKQCERVEELFGPELAKDVWIMGDSATRIKHGGKFIYESFLPNAVGRKIIAKLLSVATDQVVIGCTPSAAFILNSTPADLAEKIRHSYAVVKQVEDLQSVTEDFVKISVFDPKLRCFETVKELSEFSEQAYMVASEAAWIDISNYGVHKGTTVKKLQDYLGITKAETIAFGDGFNDFELFGAAGTSFAMKNAFPEVQEAADFIAKSNDESGVFVAVEKLLAL